MGMHTFKYEFSELLGNVSYFPICSEFFLREGNYTKVTLRPNKYSITVEHNCSASNLKLMRLCIIHGDLGQF